MKSYREYLRERKDIPDDMPIIEVSNGMASWMWTKSDEEGTDPFVIDWDTIDGGWQCTICGRELNENKCCENCNIDWRME